MAVRVTTLQLLERIFRQACASLGIASSFPLVLKEAKRPEFGDYQVNGVMAIAKTLQQKPQDLARQIIARVNKSEVIDTLAVAGPGFINITLTREYLNQNLTRDLLQVKLANPHKIVIDYSSPNLAKEMHVGHLRSTIIGDALVRLYEFLGCQVIRRNHVGDWGTQFGMLLAYLLATDHEQKNVELALSDLEDFYRQAKSRFDADQDFAEKARDYVVKLQAHDPQVIALWRKFIEISLNHCQKVYARLNTKLTLEDAVGESAYNDLLPRIVDDLVAKGVAVDSDGAKCVFFTQEELGAQDETPFIIQKKDGAYLYATTDIAAVYDRVKNLESQDLIYVIDARQSLHLKQLFATVRRAQIADEKTGLTHVAFGVMLGEDNKPFKTRSGGTVKLISLIDEAVARAKILVKEQKKENPSWSEDKIASLAEALGVAAIKYADLSKNRLSDYVFSYDQMLAFEGNTAPYMLYAYVRINSIFKKAGRDVNSYLGGQVVVSEVAERNLALHLLRFSDRILEAAAENYPHYICGYIYELAGLFMRFYEECPIIQAENPAQQNSRLALAALTAEVLRVSLDLLGIAVVEEM